MKPRYYILLALTLTLFAFGAKSATTYTVYNVPPMRLSVGISGAQTTGIKLSAPIRNGESVTYPALTGGILQLKNARFEEHIYYASGSVASSTLEVTLYGVVRGYCWDEDTFASCEAGRTWAKGTETTLVNDMRLFNFSLKKDLVNTTVGSGAILCGSTVNPCMFQGRYTTAQRDAFTWKGGAGEGTPIIHNTTTGTLQWWDGSTWTEIGDTGTVDATESVAGKVELGTLADQSGATLLGSTGAPTVVQTQYLTGTGGRPWRIGITGIAGILTGSLLGTGNQYANGGKTHVSGTGAWVADDINTNTVYSKVVALTPATSTVSATSEGNFAQNYTIPANDLVAGVAYRFTGQLQGNTTNAITIRLKLGSTTIDSFNITPATNGGAGQFTGVIFGSAAAGASVTVYGDATATIGNGSNAVTGGESLGSASVATNGTLVFQVSAQVATAGDALMTSVVIEKLSTTAFAP